MFEAKLTKGIILRRLLDAIKDLVTEATWDCSDGGISLQAMDSSHVSLVSLQLRSEAFDTFRCDRTVSLGINLASMSKIIKCAGTDDAITIKCSDNADTVTFVFESPKNERVSEYEMKLMDLDGDHLGIPDTEYKCVMSMPSNEFRRVCNDLITIGESVQITCTKEGVRFLTNGDLGSGNIKLVSTGMEVPAMESVRIDLREAVTMSYSLKYLAQFTKATACSPRVSISLSDNVPAVVEYLIMPSERDREDDSGVRRKAKKEKREKKETRDDGDDAEVKDEPVDVDAEGDREGARWDESRAIGHVRFYLAPKIEDETE